MEKNRKLKVIILSTLIVGILTLTIAFSALSRTLDIGGVGKMDAATWDVHFENLSDASITRDAIEVSKPNISLDKCTVENINVKLTKPKDEIKYVVDIVNKGTIDAEVNIIAISDLTEDQKELIDFGVYYLNGTKITKYDLLEPEDVKSIVIKIRYKDNITEFELPSEPLKINLSCQIEYVQSNAEIAITTKKNLDEVKSILDQGWNSSEKNIFWGGKIIKEDVESITFLGTLKVPTDARNTVWDASLARNGSVVAWYTDIDNNDLYELNIGGNKTVYAPVDSSYLFKAFINLKEINFNNVFDTSLAENMYWAFCNCTSLTILDLNGFNTSSIKNMGGMFTNCSSLINLSLNSFDTSKVTYMSGMFSYCSSLISLDLSNFDTANVTDMNEMFYCCSLLESLNISSFDTSNVKYMNIMFSNCEKLRIIKMNNASFENLTYFTSMLNRIPVNFTIYVKDENAKNFILGLRSDANVIIEPLST